MNRRNFLKLGALFVPLVAAPTVAYSFLTRRRPSLFTTCRLTGQTIEVPFSNGCYVFQPNTELVGGEVVIHGPMILQSDCHLRGLTVRCAADFGGDYAIAHDPKYLWMPGRDGISELELE